MIDSAHSRIMQAMRDLTGEQNALPSMDAIARRAGVSKGGLMHHFPTRAALLADLVRWISEESVAAFRENRAGRSLAEAWLEASVDDSELQSFVVMVLATQALRATEAEAPTALADFSREVEAELTGELDTELDGPLAPLIVRLVGDGLLFNAILGDPVSPGDHAALVAHFSPGSRSAKAPAPASVAVNGNGAEPPAPVSNTPGSTPHPPTRGA